MTHVRNTNKKHKSRAEILQNFTSKLITAKCPIQNKCVHMEMIYRPWHERYLVCTMVAFRISILSIHVHGETSRVH
jgi:hypothetical protein